MRTEKKNTHTLSVSPRHSTFSTMSPLELFLRDVTELTGLTNFDNLWNPSRESQKISYTLSQTTCSYVFQKGKNPGKVCGEKADPQTCRCKKHSVTARNIDGLPRAPKQIRASVTQLHIARNDYGNYEHKTTNLVFNEDKVVFGKQVGNEVYPLTHQDVEKCIFYSFKWLPECVREDETEEPMEGEVPV